MQVFDTARYNQQGLGVSLGQCGNHKGRAQRAEDNYYATQNAIDQLTKEKDRLLNGELQAQYDNLNTKQVQLQDQINQLNSQIKQAYLLRDAWINDPEKQAQLEGMGWGWFKRNFVKPLNNLISCDQWTEKEAHWNAKIHPLLSAKGVLEGEISKIREKQSPKNLGLMRETVQKLETEKSNLTNQLNGILREIDNARKDYQAKKEAALKEQQEKEKTKNIILWGTIGVSSIIAVIMIAKSKKSKTKN